LTLSIIIALWLLIELDSMSAGVSESSHRWFKALSGVQLQCNGLYCECSVVYRSAPADRSDMLRDDRPVMRGSSPPPSSDRYRRTRDRSRSRERRRRSRSRDRRREKRRSGEREIKKEPVDEAGAGAAGQS